MWVAKVSNIGKVRSNEVAKLPSPHIEHTIAHDKTIPTRTFQCSHDVPHTRLIKKPRSAGHNLIGLATFEYGKYPNRECGITINNSVADLHVNVISRPYNKLLQGYPVSLPKA